MADAPTYDFPVISDDEKKAPKPGDTWEEKLYEATDARFAKGRQMGRVELEAERGQGPPYLTARFTFNDGDTVTLRGEVPGMGSWIGKGRVEYVPGSGSGKFKNRTGSMEVEFENPKRWG